MFKPKKNTCTPISSDCIKWNGPDIPCLRLCKGDTITDVMFKLATSHCDVLMQLDPDKYDLSCLELSGCSPVTFSEMLNAIIQKICEINDKEGSGNAPLPPFILRLIGDSENPQESIPQINLTGGVAPYTYKWRLQQKGGTTCVIGNDTASSYATMITSVTPVYGYGSSNALVSGAPARVSYHFTHDVTHAWHFKLEVTDSTGRVAVDYWTTYHVYPIL